MNLNRDVAYVTHLLDQAMTENRQDSANNAKLSCRAADCGREFRNLDRLRDHAEAVHTFEDIRRILAEYIRETYGKRGDYKADPIVPAIWTWIDDLAADWVVFMVEEGNDSKLLKASYTLVDGNVTIGEAIEVRRRTVYEPVKTEGASL